MVTGVTRWVSTALAVSGLLAAGTAGAGCAAEISEKESVAESFDALRGSDEKSDSFGRTVRLYGSLDYGQSQTVTYRNPPRYSAFKFAGQPGDEVDIWVKSNRDAVAYLVDNAFNVIAYNDDASSTNLDSHIEATLTPNTDPAIVTYYILFREYRLRRGSFTVSVEKKNDFYACEVDADCVKVHANCCPHQGWTSVNADSTDAYHDSLECPEPTFCIAIAPPPDHRVAQCNNETNQCELVSPQDIVCGGFRISNPHECPAGYQCRGDALYVDGPGECVQQCGGFAGFACTEPGQVCVDDPNDDCDPENGGADCGGICVDAAGQCEYNGNTYNVGDTFPSSDGCNTCSCGDDGSVACTERACLDCRVTGCGSGQHCDICRTINGPAYVCLPNGAVC